MEGTASEKPGGKKQHVLSGGRGLGTAGGTGLGQRMALGANPGSPPLGWVTPAQLLISELVDFFFYKIG